MKSNQDQKIVHVYFLPGMAAGPDIFEHIRLSEKNFRTHYLTWKIPEKNETLANYAKRLAKEIRHPECVLIGVSLGGVVAQEMSKHLSLKKLIIISSVKTRFEVPRRMRWGRKIALHRFLPTSLVRYVEHLEHLPFGRFFKKRLRLYKRYMEVKDKKYLDWAFKQMLYWNRKKPIDGIVHIHGEKDIVFPIKYIGECIVVPKGTHIMIINRYRWFNRHLPEIIYDGKLAG